MITKINRKFIVLIFFIILLFIGLNIYTDYGISCDEGGEYSRGIYTFDFIFKNSHVLTSVYHGVAFSFPLFLLEKILALRDLREIFLMRHLATFLLFYLSVFFFYLLCKDKFKSWKIGLLGSLFLILSPRIFAHSFYNSKDLAFLSLFIISIYTLFKYLDKKTFPRAFWHALICAILIDVRIVGSLVPLLTFLFIGLDLVLKDTKHKEVNFKPSLLLYTFLLTVFTIFFWPILWENPIYHFIRAFSKMAHYPWLGSVLYLGEYIKSSNLPWHYTLLWILITTPVLYSILFLVGIFSVASKLISQRLNFYKKNRKLFIILLWFFIPLLAVILLKSILYDSWRQMFFIYPAFLILSLTGFVYISEFIKKKLKKKYLILNLFVLIVITSLVSTVYTMVKIHPYQNVYFNPLARKVFYPIKQNFELDYWGLSYRRGVEYILANNGSQQIKIYTVGYPGVISSYLISAADRKRLVYVNEQEADYLISNYRWHKEEYNCEQEVYNIKINGEKIMIVCKLKD